MSIRESISNPVAVRTPRADRSAHVRPAPERTVDAGPLDGGRLDDDQLGQLRHVLLGMLDVLTERIAATSELQRRLHDPSTQRDIVHEILGDRMAESRAEFEAAVLALEAMGRDAYGPCRSCGSAIGFDRLRTQPTASSCWACEDLDPAVWPADDLRRRSGPRRHLSDANTLREIS